MVVPGGTVFVSGSVGRGKFVSKVVTFGWCARMQVGWKVSNGSDEKMSFGRVCRKRW